MSAAAVPESPPRLVEPLYLSAALVTLAVMVGVIVGGSTWALNFMHVLFGLLWTGIDLFMGFVIGPILRNIAFESRRAVALRLMPRTLFLMPALSIVTGTTGWFLAGRLGYLSPDYALHGWIVGALAILTVLTIQGLGILLPVNVRVFLELRKPAPDGAKIGHWMRRYVRTVSIQGLMQVAIVVVMARLRMG